MNSRPTVRNASDVVMGSVSSVSGLARDSQLVAIDSDAQQLDAPAAALDTSFIEPASTGNETTEINGRQRACLEVVLGCSLLESFWGLYTGYRLRTAHARCDGPSLASRSL